MKAANIPAKWHWHYRALLALRSVLVDERDARNAALRAPVDGGIDKLDRAEERQERDEILAELSAEDAELSEIEAALERIRDGTYGICADTGQPISSTRLRALPWTRFSHDAALRRERAASP